VKRASQKRLFSPPPELSPPSPLSGNKRKKERRSLSLLFFVNIRAQTPLFFHFPLFFNARSAQSESLPFPLAKRAAREPFSSFQDIVSLPLLSGSSREVAASPFSLLPLLIGAPLPDSFLFLFPSEKESFGSFPFFPPHRSNRCMSPPFGINTAIDRWAALPLH